MQSGVAALLDAEGLWTQEPGYRIALIALPEIEKANPG
jgi:hypothetical protein